VLDWRCCSTLSLGVETQLEPSSCQCRTPSRTSRTLLAGLAVSQPGAAKHTAQAEHFAPSAGLFAERN